MAFLVNLTGGEASALAHKYEVSVFSFLEKHQMLEMHFPLRLGWFVVCRPELCPVQFCCEPGLCQPYCCTSPFPCQHPISVQGHEKPLRGTEAPSQH